MRDRVYYSSKNNSLLHKFPLFDQLLLTHYVQKLHFFGIILDVHFPGLITFEITSIQMTF